MKQPINRVSDEDIEEFREDATIDNYLYLASRSAFYPGKDSPIGVMYLGLKLAGEAGEVAENIGKALRDDDLIECEGPLWDEYRQVTLEPTVDKMTPKRREKLLLELGDCFWYLANLSQELGFLPSEVLYHNLKKLSGRTARGTLSGEGDSR